MVSKTNVIARISIYRGSGDMASMKAGVDKKNLTNQIFILAQFTVQLCQ